MNIGSIQIDMEFKPGDILSAFMVLFAVIDVVGSIPLIIDLKRRAGDIEAGKISIVAFVILIVFLILGERILHLFGVDVSSFAIAGAFVLFLIAMEMILGVEIFKADYKAGPSIFPIAFPLIAGAGTFTTLLSLRSEYSFLTITIALVINMIFVYLVIRLTNKFERWMGEVGILIMRKMFGIILLAIAVKLFLSNTGIELPR